MTQGGHNSIEDSDSKTIDPSKCSRERSREVRSYLKQYIYPFVDDNDPKNFPSQCHLNPLFDMYFDHEAHKTKVSNRVWTCQYCKKQFNSEYYIDKHMTLKHPDKLLNMTFNTQISSSNCLEDLCPIFGCKPTMPKADGNERATKSHHHYKRTTTGAKGSTGTRFSYKSAKRTSKGFSYVY